MNKQLLISESLLDLIDIKMLKLRSKDFSQERIESIDKNSKDYINSGTLSQKIRDFNDQAKTLIPYLRKCTNFAEINTQQTFNNSLN